MIGSFKALIMIALLMITALITLLSLLLNTEVLELTSVSLVYTLIQ